MADKSKNVRQEYLLNGKRRNAPIEWQDGCTYLIIKMEIVNKD